MIIMREKEVLRHVDTSCLSPRATPVPSRWRIIGLDAMKLLVVSPQRASWQYSARLAHIATSVSEVGFGLVRGRVESTTRITELTHVSTSRFERPGTLSATRPDVYFKIYARDLSLCFWPRVQVMQIKYCICYVKIKFTLEHNNGC